MISPVRLKTTSLALSSGYNKQNHTKQQALQNNTEHILMWDYKSALALKNQIFFGKTLRTGNLTSEEYIEKYDLGIQKETFEYVLGLGSTKTKRFINYQKQGKLALKAFYRGAFCEKYKERTESELNYMVPCAENADNLASLLIALFPFVEIPTPPSSSIEKAARLHALIGAVVEENGCDYRKLSIFLEKYIKPLMFLNNDSYIENPCEKLKRAVENQGKSYDDIFIQTNMFSSGKDVEYNVFYKDLLLSQVKTDLGTSKELEQRAILDAAKKVASGEIDLDEANDELPYIRHEFPTDERIEDLNELQERLGLDFFDINLLHRAFLFGKMPDFSVVHHLNSYEQLEYLGDAVLKFCADEYLKNNTPGTYVAKLHPRLRSFIGNRALYEASKKLSLEKYTLNNDAACSKKRYADFLEALIGAIYSDNGIDGFAKVYKFLDENLRDEILSAKG